MTDLVATIISNWSALDQSRVNGFLLILLIIAVFIASWGVKRFITSLYEGMRSDIKRAADTIEDALHEIRDLKLNERTQDSDISHLKQDVDDLFGRQRKRKP